jgi:two-component system, cell cycle sensor histidine kinase and response regulator CckA
MKTKFASYEGSGALGINGASQLAQNNQHMKTSPTADATTRSTFQVLILEDSTADYELVEYELRKAGLQFTATRVASRQAFLDELTERPPDIILSDYCLPQFTGLDALRLVKTYGCEAPFILVTGSQTEDVAVACMKEGAVDYILKATLTRLPSAVMNALQRRRSEQERAEALSALKRSEEQLLQSQKLEAVGRLAGGIAHDFNNLLTAIIGYCDLSLRNLPGNINLRRNLTEIKRAGERAEGLTRHLLAFSRKQVMQPKVFILNEVVVDLENMLRRMIGEDVKLRTSLGKELGQVKADPGQIEQVIMNLVVNARDAMPRGGAVVIETANVILNDGYTGQQAPVRPGAYVLLAVSDTGMGMDADIIEHIFEPFFTTKEVGKGTGLGLSMAYGIVKQSGGYIWVYSEVGKGSTFKIFLPRVDEQAEAYRAEPGQATAAARGSATILLAEDADEVRALASEILEYSGYEVLSATTGAEALSLCETNKSPIHLLLTDVIMPEMSGPELAQQLQRLHPEMRVLYMSGYTQDAIVDHGVLREGTHFLQKPFTPDSLAAKVREALGEF